MVNELCPSKGRSAPLHLAARIDVGPDLALVYAGHCSKGHHEHAAAIVLAGGPPSRIERAGDVAPRAVGQGVTSEFTSATPDRAELAASIVPLVDQAVADELRVRYLGWRRQDPYEPVLPAVATGPDRDELVADLAARCRVELEHVRAARAVLPPP